MSNEQYEMDDLGLGHNPMYPPPCGYHPCPHHPMGSSLNCSGSCPHHGEVKIEYIFPNQIKNVNTFA